MTDTKLSPPPPVTIGGLREYFQITYQLGEEQVELMLDSSRKSLERILGEATVAFGSDNVPHQMVNICHSLKGLLLNMGAPEWAGVARDLEKSARAGENRDYAAVITQLSEGLAAVLAYGEKR